MAFIKLRRTLKILAPTSFLAALGVGITTIFLVFIWPLTVALIGISLLSAICYGILKYFEPSPLKPLEITPIDTKNDEQSEWKEINNYLAVQAGKIKHLQEIQAELYQRVTDLEANLNSGNSNPSIGGNPSALYGSTALSNVTNNTPNEQVVHSQQENNYST